MASMVLLSLRILESWLDMENAFHILVGNRLPRQPHPRHEYWRDLAEVRPPGEVISGGWMIWWKGPLLQAIQHEPGLEAEAEQRLQWSVEDELRLRLAPHRGGVSRGGGDVAEYLR